MAVYEVDGVSYDIPTDDPEVAKQKIREHLGIAPTPQEAPEVDMTAQALGALKGVAGPVAPAVQGAANMAMGSVKDIGKIGSILYNNLTPGVVGEMLGSPIKYGKEAIGAYVEGHPWMNQAAQMTPKQAVQGVGGFAKNVATGAGAGLLGPESAFAMPYQMAAYEQEKIRQNPTAPEYATNPYAQMTRGEYATQGQAGAANQRNVVANQQYGNQGPAPTTGVSGMIARSNFGGLSESEQRILESDRLNMAIRLKAAKKVLGQP